MGQRDGLLAENADRSHTGLPSSRGLDSDDAFRDCHPERAAPKEPCRMRGNLSTEAGRGTSGCYVERPTPVAVYACCKLSSNSRIVMNNSGCESANDGLLLQTFGTLSRRN